MRSVQVVDAVRARGGGRTGPGSWRAPRARARAVARSGRVDHGTGGADGAVADRGQRRVGLAASTGSQVTSSGDVESASTAASASPRRTASATAAMAPPKRCTRLRTTMLDASVVGRPDDVAEHGAGLDRGQLPGVADEDRAGPAGAPPRAAGPSATATPSRSRRRSRRRGAAGCRGRGGSGCWLSGRQPSSRCRVEALAAQQLRADGVARRRAVGGLVCTASSSRPRRLAGRRGERDERLGPAGRLGLLGQQRDDPRDRRRLAGARAAGDDGEATADRGGAAPRAGGSSASPANSRARPSASTSSSTSAGAVGAERQEVGGDLALLAPVAVEVERGADEAQRPVRASPSSPTATRRSLAVARSTRATAGQGSVDEVDRPPRRRPSRSRGSVARST